MYHWHAGSYQSSVGLVPTNALVNSNRFSIRMVGQLEVDQGCCSISETGESAGCPFIRILTNRG